MGKNSRDLATITNEERAEIIRTVKERSKQEKYEEICDDLGVDLTDVDDWLNDDALEEHMLSDKVDKDKYADWRNTQYACYARWRPTNNRWEQIELLCYLGGKITVENGRKCVHSGKSFDEAVVAFDKEVAMSVAEKN